VVGMYIQYDSTRQQRRRHAKRTSRTSYPHQRSLNLSTCRSFGIADRTNKRTRHYLVHTSTPRHHWLLRRCSFKQTINQISPPTGGPISPRRNYFRVRLYLSIHAILFVQYLQYRNEHCGRLTLTASPSRHNHARYRYRYI
jgi:hypothetical protein